MRAGRTIRGGRDGDKWRVHNCNEKKTPHILVLRSKVKTKDGDMKKRGKYTFYSAKALTTRQL